MLGGTISGIGPWTDENGRQGQNVESAKPSVPLSMNAGQQHEPKVPTTTRFSTR